MTSRARNLILDAMAHATISAGYPRALADFAASRGVDRAALLARAGIAPDTLAHPDNRVAVERYVALFDAARALTGDPAIALHFGEAVRMQDVSIVGLICEACETTADVGRQINRYAALVLDDPGAPPMRLMQGRFEGQAFWVEFPHQLFGAHPCMVEAEMARLVWNTRIMFRDSPEFARMAYPIGVRVAHKDPGYADAYVRVLGAPVDFNAGENALQVDPAFLALRQPPVNRYVFGVLSEKADALLAELRQQRTLRGRVEALLIPILHTGDTGIDQIATRLGQSTRSLQRALRAENVTYETVLDELRRTMAVHFLAGRKVSVNETAYLVGFSDPAAFSRAFRRWTGSSPGAVRKGGAT